MEKLTGKDIDMRSYLKRILVLEHTKKGIRITLSASPHPRIEMHLTRKTGRLLAESLMHPVRNSQKSKSRLGVVVHFFSLEKVSCGQPNGTLPAKGSCRPSRGR